MTGARMALWGGKCSPLPPGARWVEYLESTGTQYIKTGVYATENTRVKATLMTISTVNRNWFGGSITGSGAGSNGFVFNSYSSSGIEYLLAAVVAGV